MYNECHEQQHLIMSGIFIRGHLLYKNNQLFTLKARNGTDERAARKKRSNKIQTSFRDLLPTESFLVSPERDVEFRSKHFIYYNR